MGTNRPSAEQLEKQAERQRQEVAQTYSQVRQDVRQGLDVGEQIRRRPAVAYGIAGVVGLVLGHKAGRALKS